MFYEIITKYPILTEHLISKIFYLFIIHFHVGLYQDGMNYLAMILQKSYVKLLIKGKKTVFGLIP